MSVGRPFLFIARRRKGTNAAPQERASASGRWETKRARRQTQASLPLFATPSLSLPRSAEKFLLGCVTRPRAQRRVTQPRKSLLADLCSGKLKKICPPPPTRDSRNLGGRELGSISVRNKDAQRAKRRPSSSSSSSLPHSRNAMSFVTVVVVQRESERASEGSGAFHYATHATTSTTTKKLHTFFSPGERRMAMEEEEKAKRGSPRHATLTFTWRRGGQINLIVLQKFSSSGESHRGKLYRDRLRL